MREARSLLPWPQRGSTRSGVGATVLLAAALGLLAAHGARRPWAPAGAGVQHDESLLGASAAGQKPPQLAAEQQRRMGFSSFCFELEFPFASSAILAARRRLIDVNLLGSVVVGATIEVEEELSAQSIDAVWDKLRAKAMPHKSVVAWEHPQAPYHASIELQLNLGLQFKILGPSITITFTGTAKIETPNMRPDRRHPHEFLLQTASRDFLAHVAAVENKQSIEQLMMRHKMQQLGQSLAQSEDLRTNNTMFGKQCSNNGKCDVSDPMARLWGPDTTMSSCARLTTSCTCSKNTMCRWTDAHTSRLNDMWLNGLIWQSQSEDYIRSLERVGERGRALHRSGYPTQLRRGDDWVNVKTRLHAIAMMGSPWSKKRSVQRTEYHDAKVQSVTFLAEASKLADALGKANKEHSKCARRGRQRKRQPTVTTQRTAPRCTERPATRLRT